MKTEYFKHLLAATALLLVAGVSNAHDVEVDGIYYNLVAKAKQATVTYQGENSGSAAYSGSVSIPPTIESGGVTYDVTSIGENAFSSCYGLTSINIPSGVTSIGDGAFSGCSNLITINVPLNLTNIGVGAFSYSGLTNITIPSGVTIIRNSTFSSCTNLSSVTFSSGVSTIQPGAFSDCSNLTSIIIPSNVTRIEDGAFRGCSELTSITIEGTGFITIFYQAFYGLNKLKTVSLHGGDIGILSFGNCPNLEDVFLYGNMGFIESDAFEGSYIESATLHVPSELLTQVESTAPWSQFGTIVAIDPVTYPTTATLTDGTAFEGYAQDLDMETISYARTFNNTEWQAIYLPFAMSYSDWSTNFEVARINDVHQFDDDDDGTIDRTTLEVIKLKSGSTTKANTPYLIKAKSTGEKTITVSNTKLYRAQEKEYSVSSWDTSFTFGSTYSPMSAADIANWGYLVLGSGSLHPIDPAAGTLSSYRWYLKITDRDGNPKPNYNSVKLRVLDADGTTVLEEVELAQEARENQVYDLSGRRVDSSRVRNGIYIINGKKVFVK